MELDCQRCDERLVEFLYGELDDGQSAAFEHHLRSCPKCAATAEHLRQTRDLFSHLEEAEPPPLSALDNVLAEAQAKAEQMAARAIVDERSTPSFWENLLDTIRGAAFRPALGAAFTILLVAGIGLLIWSERPRQSAMVSSTQEALTPIPTSELSTGRQDDVSPQPPEDDPTKALAQRPPRPAKTPQPRDQRTKRSNEEPSKRPSADPPASKASNRLSGNSSLARDDDRTSLSATSSPLVVEAERVAEGEQPPPSQRSQRPATTAPPSIPVIPTPPLPQAVSKAQRQQPSERDQQSQTPTATATGGASTQAQQPVRVSTPGQSQYDRGMQAYRTGRYRDAADELDAFVRSPSAPNHLVPTGMHHLAMSQQQTGNISAAARSYEQLLQRFPSYNRRPQAMLETARVYARLGSFDRAERLLNQLAAIPGWSSRAQTELARIQHLRAGQSGQMGPAHADEAASEVEAIEAVE